VHFIVFVAALSDYDEVEINDNKVAMLLFTQQHNSYMQYPAGMACC
jgi:hypothetical protein